MSICENQIRKENCSPNKDISHRRAPLNIQINEVESISFWLHKNVNPNSGSRVGASAGAWSGGAIAISALLGNNPLILPLIIDPYCFLTCKTYIHICKLLLLTKSYNEFQIIYSCTSHTIGIQVGFCRGWHVDKCRGDDCQESPEE